MNIKILQASGLEPPASQKEDQRSTHQTLFAELFSVNFMDVHRSFWFRLVTFTPSKLQVTVAQW